MKKLENLFTNTEINYKKLLIYSISCGIITGVIALLKPLKNTSIYNIAVCYEIWIFLAMYIILNSKTAKESATKTFIFFLISQPLCYLIQVPFYKDGFGIFIYYKYWFMMTLLTIPGAFIAYYTKKENILSMIILSIANSLLILELYEHLKTLITTFPYQLLAVLFIIFEVIFFIKILFKNKKKQIIMYIIFLLLAISLFAFMHIRTNNKNNNFIGIYELEEDKYKVIEVDKNVEVKLINKSIVASTKKEGEYIIKIENSKNEVIELLFKVEGTMSDLSILEEGDKDDNKYEVK